MKKTILAILVLALLIMIGYAVYKKAPRGPEAGEANSEPRVFTEKEKVDILKTLAGQSTSTVPSVADQQKILKALAGDSQAVSGKPNASSTPSSGGMSDEEKRKILESLAK